jgi:imidazole glycerol phosphate synthase glutamine amidotransferase subunit
MITTDVVVVDYGMGNVHGVVAFLRRLGCQVVSSSRPAQILAAKALFIPGVGAFDSAMRQLEQMALLPILQACREQETLIVGICLGMQLMAESSIENVHQPRAGLGWINGDIRHLSTLLPAPPSSPVRLPHTGWNSLRLCSTNPQVPDSLRAQPFSELYFNHSYYFRCPKDKIIATTQLTLGMQSVTFPALIRDNNLVGFQCHPEKSQADGGRLVSSLLQEFDIPHRMIGNEDSLG